MSIVSALQRITLTRKLIYRLGEPRGQAMVTDFEEFLRPGETLLDVGTGIGNAAVLLLEKGYALTPLDVVDLTFTNQITPVIYDGEHMPFKTISSIRRLS